MAAITINSTLTLKGGRFLAVDTSNTAITVVNSAGVMPTFVASGGALTVATDPVSSAYVVYQNDSRICYGLSRIVDVAEIVNITIPAGAYTDGGDSSAEYTEAGITVRGAQDYYADTDDLDPGTTIFGAVQFFATYWSPAHMYADYVFNVPRGEDPGTWWPSGFPKSEYNLFVIDATTNINDTIRVAWTGGGSVTSGSITFTSASGTLGAVTETDGWFWADLDTTTRTGSIVMVVPAWSTEAEGFTGIRMFDAADVGANAYTTAQIYSGRFAAAASEADWGTFRFSTGSSNTGVVGLANLASILTDTGFLRTQNQQHIGGTAPRIISARLQADESNWGENIQNSSSWKVIEVTTDIPHELRTGAIPAGNFQFKTGHPPVGVSISVGGEVVRVVDATTYETVRWTGHTLSPTAQPITDDVPIRTGGPGIHPADIASICNSLTLRPWVNVTRGWTDADYDAYADALTASTLPVYLEIDNEWWNTGQRQSRYYGIVEAAQGLANFKEGFAYEANRIFARFRARFALAAKETDCIRIISGHVSNPSTTQAVVTYFSNNAHTADGIGIAPYHNFHSNWNDGWTGPRNGGNKFGESVVDWLDGDLTAGELIGYCDWATQDIVPADGDLQTHRDMVDTTTAVFGVSGLLTCYEAGFERMVPLSTSTLQQLSFDTMTHDDFYAVALSYWQQIRDLCEVIQVFTLARNDDVTEGLTWGYFHDRGTEHRNLYQAVIDISSSGPPGGPDPPEADVTFRIQIT